MAHQGKSVVLSLAINHRREGKASKSSMELRALTSLSLLPKIIAIL